MDPERYRAVRQIFDSALTQALEARAAYLREACQGDPGLFEEVMQLLEAHQDAGILWNR